MGIYRYFIAFLLFLSMVLSYMLRANLSVAILAMVNNTALAEMREQGNSSALDNSNSTQTIMLQHDGPFLWDPKTRGIILGVFFYGYMITEVPGGWLAYRYGGKWVILIGIFWTCVFTMLTPLTVYLDMPLLLVIRVVEGLGEGVAFPCIHALLAVWVPINERSRLPAFMFAGVGVGSVVAFPLSAWLCQSEMGWPLVFYVFGAIGLGWCFLWLIFGASSPDSSRWISEKERQFINDSLSETISEKPPSFLEIPWVQIFTTPSVWAMWCSHFCYAWGFYGLVTSLPTYLKDTLNLDIASNGLYSALPYISFVIFALLGGPLADVLVEREILTLGNTRKLMNTIGSALPGALLLAATSIGSNKAAAICIVTFAVGTQGFAGSGYNANNLDIAGRFAGVTCGIGNMLGSVAGALAPVVSGYITNGDTSVASWRIVFGITAGICWFSAIFFLIFSSGETAKWAKLNNTQTKGHGATVADLSKENVMELKEQGGWIQTKTD